MEIEFHKHASFTGLTPKHRRSYTLALSVFQFDGGLGRRLGHDHNGERENQQQRKRKQNCAFHGTHIIARSSLASAGRNWMGRGTPAEKWSRVFRPFRALLSLRLLTPGLRPGLYSCAASRLCAYSVVALSPATSRQRVPQKTSTNMPTNYAHLSLSLRGFVPTASRLCPVPRGFVLPLRGFVLAAVTQQLRLGHGLLH